MISCFLRFYVQHILICGFGGQSIVLISCFTYPYLPKTKINSLSVLLRSIQKPCLIFLIYPCTLFIWDPLKKTNNDNKKQQTKPNQNKKETKTKPPQPKPPPKNTTADNILAYSNKALQKISIIFSILHLFWISVFYSCKEQ